MRRKRHSRRSGARVRMPLRQETRIGERRFSWVQVAPNHVHFRSSCARKRLAGNEQVHVASAYSWKNRHSPPSHIAVIVFELAYRPRIPLIDSSITSLYSPDVSGV